MLARTRFGILLLIGLAACDSGVENNVGRVLRIIDGVVCVSTPSLKSVASTCILFIALPDNLKVDSCVRTLSEIPTGLGAYFGTVEKPEHGISIKIVSDKQCKS
jgi:hypothetical protein